jgi:hypothetical protein
MTVSQPKYNPNPSYIHITYIWGFKISLFASVLIVSFGPILLESDLDITISASTKGNTGSYGLSTPSW